MIRTVKQYEVLRSSAPEKLVLRDQWKVPVRLHGGKLTLVWGEGDKLFCIVSPKKD